MDKRSMTLKYLQIFPINFKNKVISCCSLTYATQYNILRLQNQYFIHLNMTLIA